jgi:outer membrane protein OmpA-like peptidoglycan-associated protein
VSSGTVVGYVQREGYSANDVKLSAARAKVVAQFLSANGVKVRLVSMGKGALDSSTASRKAVLNLRYAK